MTLAGTRVVKLGGRLLVRDDLSDRFARWRATDPRACDIVIVGGGARVDAVRAEAMRRGIHEAEAHRQCLDCMAVNASEFAQRIGANVEDSIDGILDTSGLIVFDCRPFLESIESTLPGALPHDWSVSSDSIASRVAEYLSAELVLLKSTACTAASWHDAARTGYVDDYFPHSIKKLTHVSAIDLTCD